MLNYMLWTEKNSNNKHPLTNSCMKDRVLISKNSTMVGGREMTYRYLNLTTRVWAGRWPDATHVCGMALARPMARPEANLDVS